MSNQEKGEPEIAEPGMTMREAIQIYEENGWQLLSRGSMTETYFSRSTPTGNETATLELDGDVFNHTSGINIPGQNEAQNQTPADLRTKVEEFAEVSESEFSLLQIVSWGGRNNNYNSYYCHVRRGSNCYAGNSCCRNRWGWLFVSNILVD